LITEFVVDRVEQSFQSSFSVEEGAEGGVATLPSIQEFVVAAAGAAGAPEETAETVEDGVFIQRVSRGPSGEYEARHEAAAGDDDRSSERASAPDLLADPRGRLSGSEDAIVNEIVEPVSAWEASAGPSVVELPEPAVKGEPDQTAARSEPQGHTAPPSAAPEVWVAEERDAFDWHAAANLAVPPAEAQRAAEEWSSTEWDRANTSVQDHVAAILAQVSRRVRSGDLEVHGSKQMGSEAALVAALSALLAEATKKQA
jgi:hypothetical protein